MARLHMRGPIEQVLEKGYHTVREQNFEDDNNFHDFEQMLDFYVFFANIAFFLIICFYFKVFITHQTFL